MPIVSWIRLRLNLLRIFCRLWFAYFNPFDDLFLHDICFHLWNEARRFAFEDTRKADLEVCWFVFFILIVIDYLGIIWKRVHAWFETEKWQNDFEIKLGFKKFTFWSVEIFGKSVPKCKFKINDCFIWSNIHIKSCNQVTVTNKTDESESCIFGKKVVDSIIQYGPEMAWFSKQWCEEIKSVERYKIRTVDRKEYFIAFRIIRDACKKDV